jgi:putative ABC transport system ATP-binding protein
VIDLTDVGRTFVVGQRPVLALKSITLTIAAGEHVSIMGPSGSGKSTLLNLLGCLDRPTSGTYRFAGKDVGQMNDVQLSLFRRNQIGFVFQFFHLVPRLTAAGNVELPMIFAGIDRDERQAKVRDALEVVGLAERAEHRPDQLSGGEQQRVAIARAMVMRPAVLLADEPTGNLDSTSGREIVNLIEDMNRQGLTLIVVTHDPDIGERARRRIRLMDGDVVSDEQGAVAEAAIPAGRARRS